MVSLAGTIEQQLVQLLADGAPALLARLHAALDAVQQWDQETIEAAVREVAEAAGLKLGAAAQPLRAALTGRKTSPGIFDVLDLLGEPQRTFPVIHVTGTNGKTSTARIVESVLRESGLKTGRFTSPHLQDIRERITIGGELISREAFLDAWADIAPFVDAVDTRSVSDGGPRMTYFEVLVALAYTAFADAPVDVAIVEVGMGGSWDATNVVEADVAVITPVGIDHQHFLGDTIEEIATEKAGIIHPDAIVVSAPQEEEVLTILRDRSDGVGARLVHGELGAGGDVAAGLDDAVVAEGDADALEHLLEEGAACAGARGRADLLVVEDGEHRDVVGAQVVADLGQRHRAGVGAREVVETTRGEEDVVSAEDGTTGGVGRHEVVSAHPGRVDTDAVGELGDQVR